MKVYGWPAVAGLVASVFMAPAAKSPGDAPETMGATGAALEEGRLHVIRFNDLALPGRIADAKATGFTECTADYYGYACRRLGPTQLMGVTAEAATLALDGKDHFADAYFTPDKHSGDVRKISAEELAYGSVVLTFAKSEYDSGCVDKHQEKTGSYSRPAECIKNKNSIAQLEQSLLDAGWVMARSKGGYQAYVHPFEVVEITTKDETATIRRVSPAHVKEAVARHAERHAAKSAAESDASSVLEQMKQ